MNADEASPLETNEVDASVLVSGAVLQRRAVNPLNCAECIPRPAASSDVLNVKAEIGKALEQSFKPFSEAGFSVANATESMVSGEYMFEARCQLLQSIVVVALVQPLKHAVEFFAHDHVIHNGLLLHLRLGVNVVKYLGAAYLIYLGVRKLLVREELQQFEIVSIRLKQEVKGFQQDDCFCLIIT